MLGTSWECHKVREFALRPMGDFLLVLDHITITDVSIFLVVQYQHTDVKPYFQINPYFKRRSCLKT